MLCFQCFNFYHVLYLLCSQLMRLHFMHVYVKSDYFHLSYKKRLPTPLSIVSLLSLHFMNRTTFQLVLQLTELT